MVLQNLADVQEKFAFHTSGNTILYQHWYYYANIALNIRLYPHLTLNLTKMTAAKTEHLIS